MLTSATVILGEAGSGKTQSLSKTYALLVALGVDPSRIFAPHATAHAAAAMTIRVQNLIDIPSFFPDARTWITTFRAASLRILRDHPGFPSRPDVLVSLRDLLLTERGQRPRYDVLLLDDAEDLTPMQIQLLELLHHDTAIVLIAGDADASIASWRGADGGSLSRLVRLLPGARSVRMERRGGNDRITMAARHLRSASIQYEAESSRCPATALRIVQCSSPRSEASAISCAISDLLRDGVDAARIAILGRLHFVLDTIAETMRDMGLRCSKTPRAGLQMNSSWIGPIALLEACALAARSESIFSPGDDLAFNAAMHASLQSLGVDPGPAALPKQLRSAFRNFRSRPEIFPKAGTACLRALERIAAFSDDAAHSRIWAPSVILDRALLFFDGNDDAGALREFARSIRIEGIEDGVETILEFTRRARERFGSWDEGAEPGGSGDTAHLNAVRLLTLHASKGRSFDHVFIAGCEETLIPFLDGDDGRPGASVMAEEQRLLYVGVSTARLGLVFTWSSTRNHDGRIRRRNISPFLAALPRALATRESI